MKRTHHRQSPHSICTRVCASVLVALAATKAASAELSIDWFTIDGGGVMQSTGGDFELSASIAQPDAGAMTGADFELSGGFWFEQPPGDCNADGMVTLLDYVDFELCLVGPDADLGDPACRCFDFDSDTDIDLIDFAELSSMFAAP